MEKADTSAHMASHRVNLVYILKLLGVAALYALLAKIVLTFFSANGVVSIVWPPSGLALAVLLIGGKRYFPSVFFGAFLANAMTGLVLGVAAAIAVGNTLEALLGAWLLTRDDRFDANLGILSDYLRLVVLGGFIACSIAALNGSTTLLVSGFITTETYFPNLLHWWMGDVLGIVLLTPLILAWRRIPDDWLEPKRAVEALLLLGLMFLANQIVFLGWFHDTAGLFEEVARGYWMFLFATLVAVRLGTHGVVIALVMTAIQALLGAALGVGFFAGDIAKTGLINYWFYIIALSVVSMALAAHFTGRKQIEDALRRSEENLNRAQAVGQIGSWLLNIPTNRLEWSAETYRMFGIPQQQTIDLEIFAAITHHDDRDFVFKAWGEAMAGAPYDIEHRIVVGGQERWVRERARIERDAEGRPLTGIGTVQDITERKQAEVAQRESEKLYRSLFENMLNGFAYCQMIFEQDQPHDFIYLRVNAAFETLTGLKNVVGKRVSEVIPGIQQTDTKLFELYGRVSMSGKPERFEIYLEALQQWFWISVYSPEKGYFVATFDVVTERKLAEEKLRASEQKFMRLFMEIPIPLGVADKEGVITHFNDKFTEVFGYTTGDVPTLNEWWLKAYPDETYRRWVLDNWNDAVAKATKEGANVESAEYRVTCKNGAERIVIIGGSSVGGGVLAIFNDITERKRMDEELELFRLLVEKSGDPIFMIDDDDGCRMMYVNEAAVKHYGATREEILTWRIPDWDPNFTYEKLDEHVEEIKKLKNLTIESLHRVNGSSIVPVEISLNYILYKGRICHFGYFRNIADRKEHEEELLRSNVELEQFSYAVSHDMRQPLRMISSYLQLLEKSLANQLDGEKRGYFDIAIDGAKRIDQMLVALLEYSRVGRMGEPPTWIESRAVFDEALQFLQPAIAEAQARLNISGDWPRIFASHDEILMLLQNLIGNAAKFRIAGRIPEITVSSEMVENEWHLCVTDNGVGIIHDQIKRLFKVFKRLHSRDAYEGTGIGLALCRKIAEHHKGRIWAESAGEGQGSRFYVALPVLREIQCP